MQQPIQPRQFNELNALTRAALFASDLYRDVARNWRGIGLRLLFLVLLISWIATGIKLHRSFKHFANDEFPKVVQDLPPVTIQDGVVSSPVDQPYWIQDRQTHKTFAVIDTTGTITSLDDADGAVVLLTENKLHYRDNNNAGQTKIQDLSNIKHFYVDRPIVTSWVTWGAKWSAWVLIPIALVFSFIYRLIQGLIYAAIGMIWNSTFNAQLSYAALMRLSFVAVTPVILIDTALSLANVNVPAWSLICLVIAMVYLAIAVKANEQPAAALAYGYGAPFGQGQQQYPYQQPFPPQPFPPSTAFPPQQQQQYPNQPPFPPGPPPIR